MPTNRRLPVTCIRFATERMHSCIQGQEPCGRCSPAAPLQQCRPQPTRPGAPAFPTPLSPCCSDPERGLHPRRADRRVQRAHRGPPVLPLHRGKFQHTGLHACMFKPQSDRQPLLHRPPVLHPTTRPTRTPGPQAYLPANTVSSFFGGQLDNNALWKPVGTAPLGETRLWPTFVWVCGVVKIRQVPGRGGACWQPARRDGDAHASDACYLDLRFTVPAPCCFPSAAGCKCNRRMAA